MIKINNIDLNNFKEYILSLGFILNDIGTSDELFIKATRYDSSLGIRTLKVYRGEKDFVYFMYRDRDIVYNYLSSVGVDGKVVLSDVGTPIDVDRDMVVIISKEIRGKYSDDYYNTESSRIIKSLKNNRVSDDEIIDSISDIALARAVIRKLYYGN